MTFVGVSYTGGIDIGSCTAKAVILASDGRIAGASVAYSGTDFTAASESVYARALQEAGIRPEDVSNIVSTGYGRKSVSFASFTMTEISCHARGCLHYYSGPMTVVDVGGQDNKVIKLDAEGARVSFKMNRKCAAGTGAFIEEMALRLRIPAGDLNALAAAAEAEEPLGSYCTVFSATEVLEKIKAGKPTANIVRGIFHSVVKRVLEMDTMTDKVILTGGVIQHNPFLAELLRGHVTVPVIVPDRPQIMGALGAALYAAEN
jgi:predicted CoA-substrate-specific enzyme activase